MIIGLLLVLLAVAVAVITVVFNSGGPAHDITAFGQNVAALNDVQVLLAGITIGLVFSLGVWMMGVGMRRHRARRVKVRTARREATEASRERDALAEELNRRDDAAGRHHHAPPHHAPPVH